MVPTLCLKASHSCVDSQPPCKESKESTEIFGWFDDVIVVEEDSAKPSDDAKVIEKQIEMFRSEEPSKEDSLIWWSGTGKKGTVISSTFKTIQAVPSSYLVSAFSAQLEKLYARKEQACLVLMLTS